MLREGEEAGGRGVIGSAPYRPTLMHWVALWRCNQFHVGWWLNHRVVRLCSWGVEAGTAAVAASRNIIAVKGWPVCSRCILAQIMDVCLYAIIQTSMHKRHLNQYRPAARWWRVQLHDVASWNKNVAIANRSRVSCAHNTLRASMHKYYAVTLKSRLSITQGHWKRNHWIDHTRLSGSRVIWRLILLWLWNVG